MASAGTVDWPRVLHVWRSSGRTAGTRVVYEYWSRRYVEFCAERGARFDAHLTYADVRRFVAQEIGPTATDTAPFAAVRALWCALGMLGHELPPWRERKPRPPLTPVVNEFVRHRRGQALRPVDCSGLGAIGPVVEAPLHPDMAPSPNAGGSSSQAPGSAGVRGRRGSYERTGASAEEGPEGAGRIAMPTHGHRLRHRGVAPGTTPSDSRTASTFVAFLRDHGRSITRVRVADIDDFVMSLSRRWAPRTVAGVCSTLRAFLVFLHVTGRLKRNFAPFVVLPRIRSDRPPRALPWVDVRRILRAIDVTEGLGRRDFAMFLMMATYGMGAGEVLSLRLDDIDWSARTIRVHRPKTGTETSLPLLDPVGRALSRYLRGCRPAHSRDRNIFVSHRMPHARLSGAAPIKERLVKYAKLAGVRADFLGTHVFRHTHATRQIEAGATAKIVGDILGHRRPESTSAYVRSAIQGLRAIGLPVPK